MTVVRELVARLSFKTDDRAVTRWENRIKGARTQMKRAAAVGRGLGRTFKTVSVASAAAAAGVFTVVKQVADLGDQAAKDARKLGLTAEVMQEIGHAAKLSGTDVGTMKTGFQALARGLNDATTKGTGPAVEAFEQLGLSLDDPAVKSNDLSQVMNLVADQFSAMPDGAQKTAVAMKLFSRSGAEMIPLLNSGSDGIASMREEARELGLVMSNEAAAESEQFNDELERTTGVVKGVVTRVATSLMPMLRRWMGQIQRLTRANEGLIRQKIAEWIDRLVRAGEQLAPIFETIAKFALKLIEVIGDVADAMGGAENAILILIPVLAALKTATIAAAGPWGVLAAAIIASIPALMKVGDHIGDVMSDLTGLSNFMNYLDERNGGRTKVRGHTVKDLQDAKDDSLPGLRTAKKNLRDFDEGQLRDVRSQLRDGSFGAGLVDAQLSFMLTKRSLGESTSRRAAQRRFKLPSPKSKKRGGGKKKDGEFDREGYEAALEAYKAVGYSVDKAKLRAQYTSKKKDGKSLTALELLERDFGAGLGQAGKLSGVRPSLGTTINKITNTYEPKVQVEITASQRPGESGNDFAARVSELVSEQIGEVFSRGYLHFKGGTST